MDKNDFETYEYLSANRSDTDHFFVVQDDGTFLINRQVQYVTQVQDVKEVLDDRVRIYDVTPDQLFVDVDNSTELISVSDQFIVPDAESNLYPNNYLIQTESNMSTPQMEQIPVEEYKQEALTNLDVDQNDKPSSVFTEITLSDEQYQMLEQKGWILLETNDKIYLLDTLGLHDITSNTKLINKLKMDSQSNYNDVPESNGTELESNINSIENVSESLLKKDINSFNNVNDVSNIDQKLLENLHYGLNRNGYNDEVIHNEEKIETTDVKQHILKAESEELKDPLELQHNHCETQVVVINNDDIQREGTTLKIKTRLSLKNFPDKIVLGKTKNGKRLVARVVKSKPDTVTPMQIDKDEPNNSHLDSVNGRKWEVETNPPAINLSNLLNETEFLSLIQHLLQNNVTKCCADDIVSADSVIAQLLQIPAFKSTVLDSHLVVTKTVHNEDSLEKTVNKGLSAVITGKVSEINDQLHFVYLPYMLQNMVHLCVFPKKGKPAMNSSKQTFDVLHVQISESKQSGTNVVKVSVTVNKRSIPMDLISNIQKDLPSTMYACSACAALFKSESQLKEHQLNHCLEPDNMLTINTDDQTKSTEYSVVDNGKMKSYACMQCNAKFSKLNSCKNHLKTHAPKDNDGNKTENKANEVYKCNMCPCTYFHPSTLSKHILSRHIKMKC